MLFNYIMKQSNNQTTLTKPLLSTEQSSTNKAFSDLKGLKLSKEESNQSSFFNFFGLIDFYKVKDKFIWHCHD